MDEHVSARRTDGGSDRRKFLKRLGATLAAGVGLAILPSSSASASATCCREDACGPCPDGQLPYWCDRCGCTCLSITDQCRTFSFEIC